MKEDNKIRVAVLGSTGSVGTQALDVIRSNKDTFEVSLLTANSNVELLARQAREFMPETVIIADRSKYSELKSLLAGTGIETIAGEDEISHAAEDIPADTVLNAITGYSGLKPTVAAIRGRKRIAIANKETLVVAGKLIMELANEYRTAVLPVDSEHSAIFQCLQGYRYEDVEKIILTASGGPFRTFTPERLETVTKKEALNHPNWSMGAKITVDSATMMNKGLEMIEAKSLFGIAAREVEIVIHPQSVIHSMVQFHDSSVLAQMSMPDMRLPVLYALSFPGRIRSDFERLDLLKYRSLTFEQPDLHLFPCLQLAFDAVNTGGNMPCILNAANETAVAAFLDDRIKFTEISKVTELTMCKASLVRSPSLDDLDLTDHEARAIAAEYALSFH